MSLGFDDLERCASGLLMLLGVENVDRRAHDRVVLVVQPAGRYLHRLPHFPAVLSGSRVSTFHRGAEGEVW